MHRSIVPCLLAAAAVVAAPALAAAPSLPPPVPAPAPAPETHVGGWTVVQQSHGCHVVENRAGAADDRPTYRRPFRGEIELRLRGMALPPTGLRIDRSAPATLSAAGRAVSGRVSLVVALDPSKSGFDPRQLVLMTFAPGAEPAFRAMLGGGSADLTSGRLLVAEAPLPPAAAWQEADRCLRRVGEALLTAAPPPLHDGSAQPRDVPVPRQPPSRWIDYRSYPASAIKAKAQGNTGVAVDVDRYGYPTRCRVVKSAGFKALDDAACPQIMKRGRFFPALDANGVAVPGVWARTVIWRL